MTEQSPVRHFTQPILPPGWVPIKMPPLPAAYGVMHEDLMHCYGRSDGLRVIVTDARHPSEGGAMWRHVSMSYQNRLPSYKAMTEVKDIFIGTDKTALQVFPPRSKHVNIMQYCLHLWHCLDGDVTPDFTEGGG